MTSTETKNQNGLIKLKTGSVASMIVKMGNRCRSNNRVEEAIEKIKSQRASVSPHVGSGLITSRNGAINARDNSLVNMSTHHNTRDDSQTNESQGRYIAQVKLAAQQENSTGKHTARNFRRMKKSSLPRINSNERGNSGSKDEPALRETSDYTAMTT